MACGPKEYRAHAQSCLRRARIVRNPILAGRPLLEHGSVSLVGLHHMLQEGVPL